MSILTKKERHYKLDGNLCINQKFKDMDPNFVDKIKWKAHFKKRAESFL